MKKFALSVCAAMTVFVPQANAAVALMISDLTGQSLSNPPFTLGWAFIANNNIAVTGLGVFDDSRDGLTESHNLGLWDVHGALLASTTIGAGTSGSLINQFRYNSVAPTLLSAGNRYFIGALYTSGVDNLVFTSNNLTTDAAVTYLNATFAFGGALANPTTISSFTGFFGPNFTFNNVPEPASWALMIAGFGLVGAAMRRSRGSVRVTYA